MKHLMNNLASRNCQPDFELLEPRLLLSQVALPLDALGFSGDVPALQAASLATEPGTAEAATGTLIAGVPAYYWHRGCGPTAAGMVIGYWDTQGYDDLVVGDATTQTSDVDNMIASPEHYADYALPIDGTSTGILPDKSSTGGAHANNSVADWMQTSWSSRNNYYGWSWFSNMDDGLDGYAQAQGYTDANAWNETWGAFEWNDLVAEVDAGRPMLFLVDTEGNGLTNHIITAIGYDATTNQYAAHDTWDYSVHWYDFAPLGSGQPYGIYGATFFDPGTASADDTLPTAALTVADVTNPDATTHTFTVTYSDNVAIDESDITGTNVRVTAPDGTGQYAALIGVDVDSDGTPRTATLRITAPGGTWGASVSGTYTVSIRASQVSDTSGNFVVAGDLGTFEVALPDEIAPSAGLVVADILANGNTTHTFTVTFSDNEAVDVSTFDSSDVRVTGPNGFDQLATFIGADVSTDGTPRTATYSVTCPGTTWYSADNGTYTMSLESGQVSDTSGNVALGAALGQFDVSITPPQIDKVPHTTETPDLRGVYFSVPKKKAKAGSTVGATFEVANTTGISSGTFTVSFYLTAADTVTSADYLIGQYTVDAIGDSGATGELIASLILPSWASPDSPYVDGVKVYRIGMVIDSADSVAESDETNNANRGTGLDSELITVRSTRKERRAASGGGSASKAEKKALKLERKRLKAEARELRRQAKLAASGG